MRSLTLVLLAFIFQPSLSFASPLPAQQAFQFQAKRLNPNALELNWKMPKGYYLYRDRIHLIPVKANAYMLGSVHFPPALAKTDKQGKPQLIYKDHLQLSVPVLGKTAGEETLHVKYQGCSEEGFCYPPQTVAVQLQLGTDTTLLNASLLPPPDKQDIPTEVANEPLGAIESLLADHTFPLILLSFFGFGLLLSFTPCVLPMIPVLSGIILKQPGHTSSKKAFLLSLSYVLGLSTTYALIGISFALLGSNLQLLFQSPWMHAVLAILFILLALSMFDLFELRPPSQWQAWFSKLSKQKKGGPYWSSALMGALSTLVLSPCVTPPLVGTLAYIAHTGNLLLGGLALFALGLGSGTPLLLIGTSAAHYLPKAGHWMYAIKSFFGLILLGLAIQLLSSFLPKGLIMALWGCLLLSTGIFVGALTPAYSNLEKIKQCMGLICVIFGTLILIGASMGHLDPLQPLSGLAQQNNSEGLVEQKVYTLDELQKTLRLYPNQAIMLDFYADWCADCRYIEAHTFKARALQTALQQIKVIKVDLTPNNQASEELLHAYGVVAPPTFIFINKRGEIEKNLTITGEASKEVFIKHIQMSSL